MKVGQITYHTYNGRTYKQEVLKVDENSVLIRCNFI